ncbi:hypothetical protein AAY473_029295 [Plecturocebus cupreus]
MPRQEDHLRLGVGDQPDQHGETTKVKEEHGAAEGRFGKRWLPPGLTLELRSSRRFPGLLLRSLMEGDLSRFLILLVMVDPSTAIMTRNPLGQSLAQSWVLFQQRHCLPTPQGFRIGPLTDLRWQKPPYYQSLTFYLAKSAAFTSRYCSHLSPHSHLQALHSFLQRWKERLTKKGDKILSHEEMPGPRPPEAFNWRNGWDGPYLSLVDDLVPVNAQLFPWQL